jgi:hypothetical protein
MVVLTLKAKHDHLQKVASTRDYVKALAEFVWSLPSSGVMHLDLSDEETLALLNLLTATIENDVIRCRRASRPCEAFSPSSARWDPRHRRPPDRRPRRNAIRVGGPARNHDGTGDRPRGGGSGLLFRVRLL